MYTGFQLVSVAEQAGLNLTWSKISEDTFSLDRLKLFLYGLMKFCIESDVFKSLECIKSTLKQKCTKISSVFPFQYTVIFLSFWTDRSGQTVQTQIRLLLERSSLIRVYTVCHSLCIFWMHYTKEKLSFSTFRVITTNFLSVRIFRKFTVVGMQLYKDLYFT